MDAKEEELAALPVGIEVIRTCLIRVRAERSVENRSKRYWRFTTTVKATSEPLIVQEFGCLVRHRGKWVFNSNDGPLTGEVFASLYACPGAQLVTSNRYSFTMDWNCGRDEFPADLKWYFIATNSRGKRVKGDAILEARPSLQTESKRRRLRLVFYFGLVLIIAPIGVAIWAFQTGREELLQKVCLGMFLVAAPVLFVLYHIIHPAKVIWGNDPALSERRQPRAVRLEETTDPLTTDH